MSKKCVIEIEGSYLLKSAKISFLIFFQRSNQVTLEVQYPVPHADGVRDGGKAFAGDPRQNRRFRSRS